MGDTSVNTAGPRASTQPATGDQSGITDNSSKPSPPSNVLQSDSGSFPVAPPKKRLDLGAVVTAQATSLPTMGTFRLNAAVLQGLRLSSGESLLPADVSADTVASVDVPTATANVTTALATLNSTTDAFNQAQADLNRQLNDIGPALTGPERDQYIADYHSQHDVYATRAQATGTLESNLSSLQADPSSITPDSAKALLEGYKAVALSDGPTAFQFLTTVKSSPDLKAALQSAAGTDALRDAGMQIFTASLSSVIQKYLPALGSAQGNRDQLASIIDSISNDASAALDVDLVAQSEPALKQLADLKSLVLDSDPVAASLRWGKLKDNFNGLSDTEKAVAGLGVALYAISFGTDVAQHKIGEAVRDFLFTAQGSIQFLTPFSSALKFSTQAGLAQAVPFLGFAANGVAAFLHARDAGDKKSLVLGLAAAADCVAAVGSAFSFTGVGATVAAVASAISAGLDFVQKAAESSQRGKDELTEMQQLGIDIGTAKSLVYSEQPLGYVSGQTRLTGTDLRQAVSRFPTLLSGMNLSGLGALTTAENSSSNQVLSMLNTVLPSGDNKESSLFDLLNKIVVYGNEQYGSDHPLSVSQWKDLLNGYASQTNDLAGTTIEDVSIEARALASLL